MQSLHIIHMSKKLPCPKMNGLEMVILIYNGPKFGGEIRLLDAF